MKDYRCTGEQLICCSCGSEDIVESSVKRGPICRECIKHEREQRKREYLKLHKKLTLSEEAL